MSNTRSQVNNDHKYIKRIALKLHHLTMLKFTVTQLQTTRLPSYHCNMNCFLMRIKNHLCVFHVSSKKVYKTATHNTHKFQVGLNIKGREL